MTYIQAVILGLVQGLTEFLPVSSSGHLAIFEYLFKIKEENVLFFAAMLHLGTLISIIIVYFKDILELIQEFVLLIVDIFRGKGLRINKNSHRRLGFMIITATIPTAFFGIVLNDFFSSLFVSLIAVGVGLLITGTLLWVSERVSKGKKDIVNMRFRDAFLVGLFQSVAIAPGISRSGSTIVGSLLTGLNKELAVKFSFLISLPAVIGAVIFELSDAMAQGLNGMPVLSIITGVCVSTVSGYIAIKAMILFVTNKKLHYFSFYTWALGLVVIALMTLR